MEIINKFHSYFIIIFRFFLIINENKFFYEYENQIIGLVWKHFLKTIFYFLKQKTK